jgi:hypothetical protein
MSIDDELDHAQSFPIMPNHAQSCPEAHSETSLTSDASTALSRRPQEMANDLIRTTQHIPCSEPPDGSGDGDGSPSRMVAQARMRCWITLKSSGMMAFLPRSSFEPRPTDPLHLALLIKDTR